MQLPVASPLIKASPLFLLCIFSFLLLVCSGPAYNQNAFKKFIRSSPWYDTAALEDVEWMLLRGSKIFQTSDVFLGILVSVLFNGLGPRWTHTLGYLSHAAGTLLMVYEPAFVAGMALQGFSAVCLLNSSMHLVNLFPRGGKAAMCVLSGVVDLGLLLYPVLLFCVGDRGMYRLSHGQALWVVAGIAMAGAVVTVFLIADVPFTSPALAELGKLTVSGTVDPRDIWSDGTGNLPRVTETTPRERFADIEEEDLEAVEPLIEAPATSANVINAYRKPSATPLQQQQQPQDNDNNFRSDRQGQVGTPSQEYRTSNLAMSVASMSDVHHLCASGLKDNDSLMMQLMSPEFLLISFYYAACVIRNNLFLDGNEALMELMGDDGSHAETFELLLPASFFFSFLMGVIMERGGTLTALFLMNTAAVLVHLFSWIGWLSLQKITFGLFLFARCSCFSSMFAYVVDSLGIRHIATLTGITGLIAGLFNQIVGRALTDYVVRNGIQYWFSIHFVLMIGRLAKMLIILLQLCSCVAYIPLGVMFLIENSRRHYAE